MSEIFRTHSTKWGCETQADLERVRQLFLPFPPSRGQVVRTSIKALRMLLCTAESVKEVETQMQRLLGSTRRKRRVA